MRVLFDMVIHGFAAGGAVAREHPEFFTRNEQGLVETHFNWGSLNTDPGNPKYVKFMEELVLNDLRTYDIDGYRVDANSFKSPNWDPTCPRRPWQASSTLPLYRAMYAAMQREKKDVPSSRAAHQVERARPTTEQERGAAHPVCCPPEAPAQQ